MIRPVPALACFAFASLVPACRETASVSRAETPPLGLADEPTRVERGRELYAQHCPACHGVAGDGRGSASPFLFPPARDLAHDPAKLVGSTSGVALESDLVATLRRGMPGTAMPAWAWLGEPRLWDLAAYVRSIAADRDASARPLPIPPPSALAWDDLDRGAALYAAQCAACHGDDGRGVPSPDSGAFDWTRDFTAGLLKGGATREELWKRIRIGMPGTAMGPTELDDANTEALVAHVRGLIRPGESERFVQQRRELVARRVADGARTGASFTERALAGDVQDARELWHASDELRVVLAPLRGDRSSVREAFVSALHDGESLALRVRWDDASNTPRAAADVADAVALQLSSDVVPPLFGMGSTDHPVSIWHWRADSRAHPSARPHAEGADALAARGVNRLARSSAAASALRVRARATERGWEVVFVRALRPWTHDEIELTPGVALQLACAVWNDAAGDAGARKSAGIWQELVLEP